MYESHFGLTHTPFTREISPEALYRSVAYREALTRLRHIAERRQFMVLTGQAGVGKSTLLRSLKENLDRAHYEPVYIGQTLATVSSFFEELLAQLRVEIPFRRARRRAAEVLLERHHQQRTPVLLVDEAQHYPLPLLEALRGLMNYECDTFSPFALILAGGPELRRRLAQDSLAALNDRVQMRSHLEGLQSEETTAYIRHQLETAGVTQSVFTDRAMERLHEASAGIPRRINQIATLALMGAASQNVDVIDDTLVDTVIRCELGEDPR